LYGAAAAERAARSAPRAGRGKTDPQIDRIAARGTVRKRRRRPRKSWPASSSAPPPGAGTWRLRGCLPHSRTRGDVDALPSSPRAARIGRGQTKVRAGALDDAISLLSSTDLGALDELDRARVDLLRAAIAFVSTHGSDAPALLLGAAAGSRRYRRRSPVRPISRLYRRRCSRDVWRRRAQARSMWPCREGRHASPFSSA